MELGTLQPETLLQLEDPDTWPALGAALTAAGVGVAIWDSQDRYVCFNNAYLKVFHGLHQAVKVGVTFETVLRTALKRGLIAEGLQDSESWLKERLRRHREPDSPFEQRQNNGRWYRISEQPTSSGGTIGIWVDITDVKTREERLQESEYRFREFAQSFGNRVWETDVDHRFTYVLGDMGAGLSLEQLMGRRRWELPGMNSVDMNVYRALAMARKPIEGFQFRWLDNYRKEHWFEVHGKPSYRGGKFIGYRGVSRNITEQVLAQESARSAREQLAMAVDNLSEHLLLCNPNDEIIVSNGAFKKFNHPVASIAKPGATYTDFLRAGLQNRLFPEAVGREEVWLEGILKRRRSGGGVFEIMRQDGNWLWVNEQRLDNNWTITIASNITERKKAEQALQESERRAAQVHAWLVDAIESMPAGFQLFDENEKLVLANSSYTEWFPWDVTLVKEKASLEDFVRQAVLDNRFTETGESEESGEDPDEAVSRVMERIRAARPTSIEIQRPNGRWFQEIDYRRDDGGIIRVFIETTDIKKNAEQLRNAQKVEAIGQLAGGIAHDFNNILQIISGFTHLALRDQPPETTAGGYLETTLKAVDRARTLVNQILTFSRRRQVEKERISLAPALSDALEMMRSTLPSSITIESHLADGSGSVLADSSQMQQVLVNLCTNAARAIGLRNGTIRIRLDRISLDTNQEVIDSTLPVGRYLCLTVTDTGPGIAPSVLTRIFEPFFSTQELGQGSGLGLAVVHGIVADHGGGITVRSVSGEGTSFSIYLPEVDDDVAAPGVEAAGEGARTRQRILFVDDEPELMKLGSYQLGRAGFDVVAASSGQAALQCFRDYAANFDLVVTDQTMPGMTGDALAKKLLELKPGLPVILCTGYSETIDEATAMNLGIGAFMMKPIEGEKLIAVCKQILDPQENDNSPDHA